MSISKQIKKLTAENYPEKEPLEWAQARIPAALKAQVESKFLSMKASGQKMNWQLLIESACREFVQ